MKTNKLFTLTPILIGFILATLPTKAVAPINELDFFHTAVNRELDTLIATNTHLANVAFNDSQINSNSYYAYVAFLNQKIAYENAKRILNDVRESMLVIPASNVQNTIPVSLAK